MLIHPTGAENQDIVFGLIAPIGTDVDRTTGALRKEVSNYGYSGEVLRLSSLLLPDGTEQLHDDELSTSELLMDRGDQLRKTAGQGDAAAGVAIAKIVQLRGSTDGRRRAWILRTLKNPDEIRLLRHVYGSRFIAIGVNEDESTRRKTLEATIRRRDPHLKSFAGHAATLVVRDESSGDRLGQNVRSTMKLADFYVETGSELVHDVKRIIRLLFGQPFETPTRDENAMVHAFAASLRSSDPGRQVGAVISSPDGDIIATGTNEVPRPGGGQYWTGDPDDRREFQLGRDHNKWTNYHLIQEILDLLARGGLLRDDLCQLSSDDRYESIRQVSAPGLDESRVNSLIEFGRITHAEMSALTDCARYGKRTQGSTIYVTAFPCHMCMRLIIASGIARIVYVDPYPKSLAVDMYGAALSFGIKGPVGKVEVSPFRGTSWRAYQRVFEMVNRDRSPDGTFEWHDAADLTFRDRPDDRIEHTESWEIEVITALNTALTTGDTVKDIPEKWPSLRQDLTWLNHLAS